MPCLLCLEREALAWPLLCCSLKTNGIKLYRKWEGSQSTPHNTIYNYQQKIACTAKEWRSGQIICLKLRVIKCTWHAAYVMISSPASTLRSAMVSITSSDYSSSSSEQCSASDWSLDWPIGWGIERLRYQLLDGLLVCLVYNNTALLAAKK